MVSKASEDLPEPESPVNTTSLSRGISTSMFFRLCSRAPRMVMARKPLVFCWRRAFRTSSISAIPGACVPRSFKARLAGTAEIRRQMVMLEHRKNGKGFPVRRGLHQRIPQPQRLRKRSGDRFVSRKRVRSKLATAGSSASNERPAPFVRGLAVYEGSVFRNDRAAPAIVRAHARDVDVLLDALGARERASRRGQIDRAPGHEEVIVLDANRPVRGEADFHAAVGPIALAFEAEQPVGGLPAITGLT